MVSFSKIENSFFEYKILSLQDIDNETLGLILKQLIKVIGRIWSLNKPRKWDKVNVLC